VKIGTWRKKILLLYTKKYFPQDTNQLA
jgi:hypothetical protein